MIRFPVPAVGEELLRFPICRKCLPQFKKKNFDAASCGRGITPGTSKCDHCKHAKCKCPQFDPVVVHELNRLGDWHVAWKENRVSQADFMAEYKAFKNYLGSMVRDGAIPTIAQTPSGRASAPTAVPFGPVIDPTIAERATRALEAIAYAADALAQQYAPMFQADSEYQSSRRSRAVKSPPPAPADSESSPEPEDTSGYHRVDDTDILDPVDDAPDTAPVPAPVPAPAPAPVPAPVATSVESPSETSSEETSSEESSSEESSSSDSPAASARRPAAPPATPTPAPRSRVRSPPLRSAPAGSKKRRRSDSDSDSVSEEEVPPPKKLKAGGGEVVKTPVAGKGGKKKKKSKKGKKGKKVATV